MKKRRTKRHSKYSRTYTSEAGTIYTCIKHSHVHVVLPKGEELPLVRYDCGVFTTTRHNLYDMLLDLEKRWLVVIVVSAAKRVHLRIVLQECEQ